MKVYFLTKNKLTHDFYLDSGELGARRVIVGKKEDLILNYFKENISLDRKSKVYFDKSDFDSDFLSELNGLLSGSKVKLEGKVLNH